MTRLKFRNLPLFTWPLVVFLASIVVVVDGAGVKALAVAGVVIVYIVTVAQVFATERNADSAAANSRRPILDVDELVDTIATRLDQRAEARRTEVVDRVPTH